MSDSRTTPDQVGAELYIVNLPYGYYGIIVKDGIIISTAPIGKWMIGKELTEITPWIESRNGTVTKSKNFANNTEPGNP